IPVDGILISNKALIDYSFVTGEAEAVKKISGDKLFAGGKQQSGVIEIEVLNSVEQSYLTQLWSNEAFKDDKVKAYQSLIDSISKRFTVAVLTIAFVATAYWLYFDATKALNVFTAVLIIACPCAIALASPFTLGNMLRIFGKQKFYLKNSNVIERLTKISTIIFDKTGTITTNKKSEISYKGDVLNESEKLLLYNTLRASNHPLSRQIYESLPVKETIVLDKFEEVLGKGINASFSTKVIKIGSSSFVGKNESLQDLLTSVHVSIDENYKGYFVLKNAYRSGLSEVFKELKDSKLVILSGDNEGEKERLSALLPKNAKLLFNQNPQQKLDFVKEIQEKGEKVLMMGDGLNDAGALAQSDVGVVISENINVFSPACDGILDATNFKDLSKYLSVTKRAINVIKWSLILSFMYNITGLYFAVTGQLEPVIAAILMPLSSISIVVFTTISTNIIGRSIK
ncbi:MAG: HAD-IC family P-type ATPase, partial [Flavobacteriaceae bacterium]|nr:HAD-IC family P-type ATPase [Flavobacteriaceae bacterium]